MPAERDREEESAFPDESYVVTEPREDHWISLWTEVGRRRSRKQGVGEFQGLLSALDVNALSVVLEGASLLYRTIPSAVQTAMHTEDPAVVRVAAEVFDLRRRVETLEAAAHRESSSEIESAVQTFAAHVRGIAEVERVCWWLDGDQIVVISVMNEHNSVAQEGIYAAELDLMDAHDKLVFDFGIAFRHGRPDATGVRKDAHVITLRK
jgi:hypothetical protein